MRKKGKGKRKKEKRKNVVEVKFSKRINGVSASWTRKIIFETLLTEKVSNFTVSVYVTDNREIRRLNKTHLRHDYATDVISFKLEENLADIVVSFEKAKEMALELGIPFKEELARYLVHGTLHALGYRDKNKADYKRMVKRQESVLKQAL